MTNCGVYIIKFKGSDKSYIGSSINLTKRFLEHKSRLKSNKSTCTKLQRAYNKYGLDAMSIEVLEYCDETSLRDKEIYYINTLDTLRNGYNVAEDTLAPMTGRLHSDLTKKLMSEKAKGNKGRAGQKLSKEHIELMRVDRKGKLIGISNNVGEANPQSKLTAKQVSEIKSITGMPQSKIAKLYGISQQQVSKIITNKRWKKV